MCSDLLSAVLFDMDGTLLDSEKLWTIGLQDLCGHLGHTLESSVRAKLVGMNQLESMQLLHDSFGLGHAGLDDSAAWLVARMKTLFAAGVVWQPGAKELLHAVRDAGLATAMVTATGRELVDVIVATISAELFDVTICGDEVPQNKPSPQPYAAAMKALGLVPEECVAIEDSVPGVASAHAAGCLVLAVPSEVSIPASNGVAVVESLLGIDVAFLRGLSDQLRSDHH